MMRLVAVVVLAAIATVACTNDPYPPGAAAKKILFTSFSEPPKTLDPQVSYTTIDHVITGPVYDSLLQYHFLERPYRLIPNLLEALPEPEPRADGRVVYRLRLRPNVEFHEDDCFALGAPDGPRTRTVGAADAAFSIMRLADPAVNSPIAQNLVRLVGFEAFGERLVQRRKEDAAFAAKRIDQQYAEIGGIEGVRVVGPLELELELSEPYPQLRYLMAMEFMAPVPWEAIVWWNGEDGRDAFAEHPVGTGPYRLAVYDKRSRIVLEKNPRWHGLLDPGAPGTVYPSEGAPGDRERGWLDPQYVGKPLPFVERIELSLDGQDIPAFTKFLQGYYDASGVIEESFERMVKEGGLSPDMAALGMQLDKAVTPAVYYIGFNMSDGVVGAAGGEKSRKLRQAMSLAVDSVEFARVFMNGRAVPAQTPIPPGVFGYDPSYVNPFRQPNLEKAAALLREAGYPDGIDPATGRPLRLTFDTGDTSARGRLRYQFFVDQWSRLGIDVTIAATSYNQFQDKVRRGTYQIFMWGWVADYPDPENFLFLLWSKMARSLGGPNTANFEDPEYDALFLRMRDLEDGPERQRLIDEMRTLLERQRPWIELFYPETYTLTHSWVKNAKPLGMSYSTLKYRDVDGPTRARLQKEWNEPVLWPAWVLLAGAIAVVTPAVVTMVRRNR
jgi:oligopeptide transport system substrate-binding protein